MKEKTYKISEVAEMLGVHPDTIRNWESEGFVIPTRIGTRGDRRYTVENIQEIKDKNLVSTLAKKNAKKRDYSNLSKEELIKEIQVLNKQKSFGLVYEDKKEDIVEECKNKAPILKPKIKFRIENKKDSSKKEDGEKEIIEKPKHILIQGDNYHTLKVLNYTHKNKIDVIYIDPPYNTGNKDFIYNDSFVDKEDAYRHSKWISFMEKRLVLARELLKDSGVIFISIDDNEQARLKLLCDEIFGEDNFVSNLIWKNKQGGGNDSSHFISEHEYVFVFAKNIKNLFIDIDRTSVVKDSNYPFLDKDGYYGLVTLDKSSLGYVKSLDFEIKDKNENSYFPRNENGEKKFRWRWSKKTVEENFDELIFKDGKVYTKFYKPKGFKSKTLLTEERFGRTVSGGLAIKDIFGDTIFSYSKPVQLLQHLLQISSKKDSIILDFFAGSGTTGHAVLELNAEDNKNKAGTGNRQVILSTNNGDEKSEHKICEQVTYERMKRVMKGYKNKKGENVEGLGGELEYFETDLIDVDNMERVNDKKKLAFTLEAGWVIAMKENTFNEIEKNDSYQIFEGVENVKSKTKNKTVAIYFKENLDKLKELESKIIKKENVRLYIFSHYTNEFVSEYAEYKNIKVCDIPEPILKVYKGFNN